MPRTQRTTTRDQILSFLRRGPSYRPSQALTVLHLNDYVRAFYNESGPDEFRGPGIAHQNTVVAILGATDTIFRLGEDIQNRTSVRVANGVDNALNRIQTYLPFEIQRLQKKVPRVVYAARGREAEPTTIREEGYNYEHVSNYEWILSINNEEELLRDGIVVRKSEGLVRPATPDELSLLDGPIPSAAATPNPNPVYHGENFNTVAECERMNTLSMFFDESLPPTPNGRENVLGVFSDPSYSGGRAAVPAYSWIQSGPSIVTVTAEITRVQLAIFGLSLGSVGNHLGVRFEADSRSPGVYRAVYDIAWAGPPILVAGPPILVAGPPIRAAEPPPSDFAQMVRRVTTRRVPVADPLIMGDSMGYMTTTSPPDDNTMWFTNSTMMSWVPENITIVNETSDDDEDE